MSIIAHSFKPYSQTYVSEIETDEEHFTILFRVVNETMDNQEIYDYEKEDTFKTVTDVIRMEIERIFHNGKDETLEIAQTKPGFYDRILAYLIEHFVKHNKSWMRKSKKTKVMANYKSFSVSKTLPPMMKQESEEIKIDIKY